MATGNPSFDILRIYLLGADLRGAGNLDVNSCSGLQFSFKFANMCDAPKRIIAGGPEVIIFVNVLVFFFRVGRSDHQNKIYFVRPKTGTIIFSNSPIFFFGSADLITTIKFLLYDPKPAPVFVL